MAVFSYYDDAVQAIVGGGRLEVRKLPGCTPLRWRGWAPDDNAASDTGPCGPWTQPDALSRPPCAASRPAKRNRSVDASMPVGASNNILYHIIICNILIHIMLYYNIL